VRLPLVHHFADGQFYIDKVALDLGLVARAQGFLLGDLEDVGYFLQGQEGAGSLLRVLNKSLLLLLDRIL